MKGVPNTLIDLVWPQAWALLQKAFEYNQGEFSEDYVYNGVKSRDFQLWIDIKDNRMVMATITRLDWRPKKLTCFVLGFAAEDSSNMSEYVTQVEAWARTQGAADMEFYGRKGLERYMKDYDYNLRYVVLGKKLED
jgi:hypothetical protein